MRSVFAIVVGLLAATCSVLLASNLLTQSSVDFGKPIPTTPSDSIDKAIWFLQENQLGYGEFKTYACADEGMVDCYFESSPFLTTFIIYSTAGIEDARVSIMREKALDFLSGEQEPTGLWKYYTSKSALHTPMRSDLDCTAVVSQVLTLFNRSFEDNLGQIELNKNAEGVINTWEGVKGVSDCEVNANVLFYLVAKGVSDERVCSFLRTKIQEDDYSCCTYCCERDGGDINYLFLFYTASRAYANGASCLSEVNDRIINKTVRLQNDDGSFGNDIDTALAVNILLNLGYRGKEVERGASALLTQQDRDGSWDAGCFWSEVVHYGSKELTTALAVEALAKYSRLNDSPN